MSGRLRRRSSLTRRELSWVELQLLRTGYIGVPESNGLVTRSSEGWAVDRTAAEAAWREHFDVVEDPIPPGQASWARVAFAGDRRPVYQGRYSHLSAGDLE